MITCVHSLSGTYIWISLDYPKSVSESYSGWEREREREREVYSDDIADTKIHSDTQLDIDKNSSTWFG